MWCNCNLYIQLRQERVNPRLAQTLNTQYRMACLFMGDMAMQSGFFSFKRCAGLLLLAGAARAFGAGGDGSTAVAVDRPEIAPCPAGQAPETQCLRGRDSLGAYYWLAMPKPWNGTLVVHAHGGPELGAPKAQRPADDMTRWSIWTRAGFAYAGSG